MIAGSASHRGPTPDVRATAAGYLARGWVPIPIPLKQKAPVERGWNRRTLASARASFDSDFHEPRNIGVLLGEPSGGLADVDLDCSEASAVASRFLPASAVFGRATRPASHILFCSPGARTKKYVDPRAPSGADHTTIVEIRSDGHQTVFPESVHPSGELIMWGAPHLVVELEPGDLEQRVSRLAAAALLGRYWPAGGRHDTQLALAGALIESGFGDERALEILCAVCHIAGDEDPDKRARSVADTRRKFDAGQPISGWGRLAKLVGADVVDRAREWLGGGVEKVIIGADLRHMTDVAERAMAREGGADPAARIYASGTGLVRVRDGKLQRLPSASVREVVGSNSEWWKLTKKSETRVPPPKDVIDGLIGREKYPHLGSVTAMATAPMLRRDGSIICEPGYDEDSGVLYLPDAEYSRVPEHPSVQELEEAIAAINDVICDFPFATEPHRAGFFAAVLTIVARNMIEGPTPAFVIDAPSKGSGKGLLASLAAIIGTGAVPAASPFPGEAAEQKKVITAHGIAGTRVALFDNVDGVLGGGHFCSALTTTAWSDRVLGKSETWSGSLRTVWLVTANNPTIGADMDRRICNIRIDWGGLGVESPAGMPSTYWKHPNVLSYALEQRPRLVTAALTILRAYVAAGMPDYRPPSWGSYESWVRVVVGAVLHAGLADPGDARKAFIERSDLHGDYERQFVRGFAWYVETKAKRSITAGELMREINLANDAEELVEYGAIREALAALLGKDATTVGLGQLIGKLEDRVFDGVRIVRDRRDGKKHCWYWGVKRVGA